jgi:hypothetical protein
MANLALAGSSKPSKAAMDIFEQIHANSLPVTLVGGLNAYTDLIMERFSDERTAATGGALVFKASFRQVRIITGQSVTVPRQAKGEDVKDLSATEQQQGTKQGNILEDVKQGKAQSWLCKITGVCN